MKRVFERAFPQFLLKIFVFFKSNQNSNQEIFILGNNWRLQLRCLLSKRNDINIT